MFKLSEIFTDNMVIQRDAPVRVFGEADEDVTVEFLGNSVTVKPDNGRFLAELPSVNLGTPCEMTVSASCGKITLKNILIGDVYIAAGQSNMEFPLFKELRGYDDLKGCYDENIRFYTSTRSMKRKSTHKVWAFGALPDDQTPWQICDEESAEHFSAIGFHFAKRIHSETGVPIGIINANRGGTRIDAHVPDYVMEEPEFAAYKKKYAEIKLPDSEADEAYEKVSSENDKTIKACKYTMEELVKSVGAEFAPYMQPALKTVPLSMYSFNSPSAVYNCHFKNKIVPLSVKAILWYQGESSRAEPDYFGKFKKLAESYRREFMNPTLPFYTIEISAYRYPETIPYAAYLRCQQWKAARNIDNCHIMTTQDVGDEFNIHPPRKKEIALRVANQVLHYEYGMDLYCDCPSYASHTVKDGKVYITLNNDDGFAGLDGGVNMTVAGADGNYYKAESVYENGKLVVWSEEVKEPVNVRYCFDSYYKQGRFFNKSGLPLAPFTTEEKYNK